MSTHDIEPFDVRAQKLIDITDVAEAMSYHRRTGRTAGRIEVICRRCRGQVAVFAHRRTGELQWREWGTGDNPPHEGETEAHRAWKDVTAACLSDNGIPNVTENYAQTRRHDVRGYGSALDMAVEIQKSHIGTDAALRRVALDEGAGLTTTWVTGLATDAEHNIGPRAVHLRLDELTAGLAATKGRNARVRRGLFGVTDPFRCNLRGESWHRGVPCSGWHVRPAPLEDAATGVMAAPTYEGALVGIGSGELVPVVMPRPVKNYGRYQMLLPVLHAQRFFEVEGDFVCATGGSIPEFVPVRARTTSHTAPEITRPPSGTRCECMGECSTRLHPGRWQCCVREGEPHPVTGRPATVDRLSDGSLVCAGCASGGGR